MQSRNLQSDTTPQLTNMQIYANPSSNRLFIARGESKSCFFSLGRSRGTAKLRGHFFYLATFLCLNLQPVQPLMASPTPQHFPPNPPPHLACKTAGQTIFLAMLNFLLGILRQFSYANFRPFMALF